MWDRGWEKFPKVEKIPGDGLLRLSGRSGCGV